MEEGGILQDDFFDDARGLACLLNDGICFLMNVDLSKTSNFFKEKTLTSSVFVLCSDTFTCACADLEPVSNNDNEPDSELAMLYKYWKENRKWGSTKWVCLKRKMKPLYPIVERMKQDGYWDEELENLPENSTPSIL